MEGMRGIGGGLRENQVRAEGAISGSLTAKAPERGR